MDYPDYALLVANSVAEHKAEAGLLVCTTGIGMSITANKVPGVRAAMVSDAESALLTRKHNDANVFCLSGSLLRPTSPNRFSITSSTLN